MPDGEPQCDITLFVACYNEKDGIIPTLNTAVAAMEEIGLAYDIVVVDDASTDESGMLVERFCAENPHLPIKLVRNPVNMGLGSNYAEAAFQGRGEYYRLVCGDNVESKETLVSLFKHVGEADLVLPYQARSARGFVRRTISSTFTALINFIGGHQIRYYNGCAICRRWDVMRWHSNSHGFGFQADLIVRLLDMGASYVEVPVIPSERDGGTSKAFTLTNICSVAHSVMDLAIRRLARVLYAEKFERMRAARRATIPRALRVSSVAASIGIEKPQAPATFSVPPSATG